jgi:thiamine monophosphate synthase
VVRAGASWRSLLEGACDALAAPHVAVWLRLAGLDAADRALVATGVRQRGHPRLAIGATPEEAVAWGYRAIHLPSALLHAVHPQDLATFDWSTAAVHDAAQISRAAATGVQLAWLSPVADVASKGRTGLPEAQRQALLQGAPLPLGALGGVTVENATRWYAEGFGAVATFGSWPAVDFAAWPRRSRSRNVAGTAASR